MSLEKLSLRDHQNWQNTSQKRGHSLDDTHKHYVLGEIIPLAKEIPHLKGEGTKAQVYFQTKLSELLRVNSVGDDQNIR